MDTEDSDEDSDEESDEESHEAGIVDRVSVGAGTGGIEDGADGRSADEIRLDQAVFWFCIVSLKQKVAVDCSPIRCSTSPPYSGSTGSGWHGGRPATLRASSRASCGAGACRCSSISSRQADDPKAANDMPPAAVEHFSSGFRTWLADGTGISAMIRWMAYGKGHRKQ